MTELMTDYTACFTFDMQYNVMNKKRRVTMSSS